MDQTVHYVKLARDKLVVFRKEHSGETRLAFWQRIVRDSEDQTEQVKCASGSITVARARLDRCKSVIPSLPLQGSLWSSAASQAEGLGVARECERIVLNRYNAAQYEGYTLASLAFGDVYCKPRDSDELQCMQRVLQSPVATSEVMGPPPPAEVKPRSLSASLWESGDSVYQGSVVVEASDASDGTGSRQVTRERDDASKAGDADDPGTMEEDHQKGNSSTEEMDQVVTDEDDEDEEEQGSK